MTVVALSLLTAALALSAPPQTDSTAAPRAQMRAVRAARAVTIDGALADDVWRTASHVAGFVQRDPDEGKAATESTVVWIAYDDGAIYLAARMYDSKPDSIIARLGRRDDYTGADRFTFYVDPYLDRRSGFWFAVDAAGTLSDGTLYNDDWDSDSWDGVWEGRAARDSAGWVVEMRIPYSQLRFARAASYTWGVNFRRELIRRNEFSYYVLRPKNSSGFVSRFADLTGIEQITPPRRVEVMPYVTSRAEFIPARPGDPFNDGYAMVPGLGGDARLGLGSNLTLNVSVNPDFGQVEVDPAVVNLSDAETFFNEKRPFFVDGSSTFEFGFGGQRNFWGFNWPGPNFFYSRRIGRGVSPPLAPPGGYADGPSGAHILGAMKLTGKVGGSWNVGGLSAVTGREQGQTVDSLGRDSIVEIEPLTFYGVYRAQKEFPDGRQGLGFLSTVAVRSFEDDTLRAFRNASALVAGADGWVFLDKNKTWVTTAWLGLSRITGTQGRILAVQQNPVHYFQQPDAEHVRVDSSATSLSGFAVRWTLAKQKGASFVNAAFGAISPGFDLNDLGFQGSTGVLNWHAGGGRTWTNAGKVFRYRELLGALFARYDWDLNTTGMGIWGSTYAEFKNYWWTNLNLAYNPQTTNNRRTRGGPITLNLPGFEVNANFGSDGRKKVSFSTYGGAYYQRSDQYDWWSGLSINLRPAANVTVSVGPNLSGGLTPAQYIGAYPDTTPPANATMTESVRYVFASLDRTELSAGVRLNWTFTPRLSLQLYAQPLVSAGEYGDFRALRTARSYDFDVYRAADGRYNPTNYEVYPNGPADADTLRLYNPDFNFRSLRGNAVLRWEYLPGSTLFLVWTHGRQDFDQIGSFRFGYSVDRMFALAPENMFMVKVSYYWNP